MRLPPFPPITRDALAPIAERHGVDSVEPRRLPATGIFNAIYTLGAAHVLRVPRDHPLHFAALRRETIVVPAACKAGVRTPALVAFDDSCHLLSVPYAIYERVPGRNLATLDLEPRQAGAIWRELGADLSRLHLNIGAEDLNGELPPHEGVPDPRELVERRAQQGYFKMSDARWFHQWLGRLAPLATAPVAARCLHGDSQATNIIVRPRRREYAAVIDWGSSGWGDPANDFGGIPLRAVPFMLEGYRSVADLEQDETIEARIVWRHLQLALHNVGRGPLPRWSWAEQPLPMLLEALRFFLDQPGGRWQELAPPAASYAANALRSV